MKEKTGTILVIDDEDIVRSMICDMLSGMGYDTLDYSDPVLAIEHYKQSFLEIPLVLIDMTMTKLNGRETFFLLKKINPGIRTIIISGSGMNEDIENILKEGNIRFLKKPLNFYLLKDSIEKAIREDEIKTDQIYIPVTEKDANCSAYHFEKAVARLGGRRDIFFKSIRSFIEKHSSAGEVMRQLLYEGDRDTLKRYAHSLRTVASSLGIVNIEEGSAGIEFYDGASETSGIGKLILEFEVQLKTVMADLSVFLKHDFMEYDVIGMSEINRERLRDFLKELKKYADLSRPLQCRSIYYSDLKNVTCCGFGHEQKETILKMLDKYDFTGLSDYLSELIDPSKGGRNEKTV